MRVFTFVSKCPIEMIYKVPPHFVSNLQKKLGYGIQVVFLGLDILNNNRNN